MTKQDQLRKVLDELTAEVSDIHAAVLASQDGLAMASTIGGAEGSRVAAMAATVHAVGKRATETAELGSIEEAVIRGKSVTFVVYDAGNSAVLALMAPGDCNLGMIHLEGRRAAGDIAALLERKPEPTVAAPPPPPAPAAPTTIATSEDRERAEAALNGSSPGAHERDAEAASA